MKRTKLINISIIGTLFFFTACSQSQPKVKDNPTKSKISIYNIMGINKSDNKTSPIIAQTEPYIETPIYQETSPIIAQTEPYIETPIYQESSPIIAQTEPYIETPPIIVQSQPSIEAPPLLIRNNPYSKHPNYIEYISYKKNNNSNIEKTLNNIEWKAKSFLGTPYVWGATGPNKFDCSGFTQWVYRDVGIKIPRVSRDQARVGEYVRYENLRRGDMVFFDTKKHRQGKVTHVGIYLGNGDFIHASSAGKKVVIYNFNKKEFYKKRFLWGRRVATTNSKYALN